MAASAAAARCGENEAATEDEAAAVAASSWVGGLQIAWPFETAASAFDVVVATLAAAASFAVVAAVEG